MTVKGLFPLRRKSSSSSSSNKQDSGNFSLSRSHRLKSDQDKIREKSSRDLSVSAESATEANRAATNNTPLNPVISQSDDSRTFQSFQYSYNSNMNSLFSSKKTVSTGFSTQPSSSSYSYHKDDNAGLEKATRVGSVGVPLRVVHEEELEEEEEPAEDSIHMYRYQSQSSRRLSNVSEDNRSQVVEDAMNAAKEMNAAVKSNSSKHVAAALSIYEHRRLREFIQRQLKQLSIAISNVMLQISQSVLNLTKASINLSTCIDKTTRTIQANELLPFLSPYEFSTTTSVGLRRIIKYVLFLIDNLLTDQVYNSSKSLVLKSLYGLLLKLKLFEPSPADNNGIESYIAKMSPQFFAIGATINSFPQEREVDNIMKSLLSKSKQKLFSDQNGSFIAPVLRGFLNENLSVVSFVFGFPDPTKEHRNMVNFFCSNSEDMHFLTVADSIVPCSNVESPFTNGSAATGTATSASSSQPILKFKSPFRIEREDADYVPISMSIACNNALTLSGTLGGYVYPRIPKECADPKLLKYQGSIFGLTCAHVVVNQTTLSENNGDPYPFVSVPSPVLINLYKNALNAERLKYDVKSAEYRAYDQAVQYLNKRFPIRKIKVKGKMMKRNLPNEKFGQIVWGERVVNNDKLSDIAIIKINAQHNKKYLNYLGDDINLSNYDPSLILSNLYVRKVVDLYNSKNGSLNHANLRVFKVGSTTNFTTGKLNGMKMVYWSEGSLKTSEFVISSSNRKNFASGGDSGSFIMSKISDLKQNTFNRSILADNGSGFVYPPEGVHKSMLSAFIESFVPSSSAHTNEQHSNDNQSTGLALVGMLHSYDGMLKQFGLFTSMTEVLDRLRTVTGLEWGVVGCENEDAENGMFEEEEEEPGTDLSPESSVE